MPNRHKIPHSIYESLPYLYMGGGVFVAAALPNVWGISSGLLLLATGVVVWWLRRTYRSASHQSAVPRTREVAALNISRDTGLLPLVWSTKYEHGHVTIDTQHRRLFELVNALLNAILDEKPKLDVGLLFDDLVKDVANHFSTEDNSLAEANLPLSQEHQEIHRKLLARCKDMAERYHYDVLKVDALYKFVAHDVVSEHILKEDHKSLFSMGQP